MEVKLMEHQIEAIELTKDHNRVAYYYDMGLGKTFIGSEKMKQLDEQINLVICQKSLISTWTEHFKTYYKVWVYDLTNKKELEFFKHHLEYKPPFPLVGIINYDLIFRRKFFLQLENYTLMLDESSMIKNEKAKRTKFILKMKPKNVILLSGTPCSGKYEELYSQCKLLGWNISKKAFWDNYIITKNMEVNGFKIPIVIGYKNVDRLKVKLRQYGAVFKKTEEVLTLPEQLDNIVNIKSTKEYKKFKKDRLVTINNQELVGDTTLTNMLYQRQLAAMYNPNKYEILGELLESTEDRVLIFYNFTGEMEEIKKLCKKLNKPISVVNGKVKDLKNYETKDNSVTLLQYQAGAMGLNLQLSNKIIYFSLPLSSELFEQSKKRTHRLGQKKTCMYYYLITEGTIEKKIFDILGTRRDFTNKLFEELEED